MVRPMAKSPPNRLRIRQADDEQVGAALDGLVDDGGADVARLEQDRLERHLGVSATSSAMSSTRWTSSESTGDVGVERQRPVDLDDVDGDQLGLARGGPDRRRGGRSGRRSGRR